MHYFATTVNYYNNTNAIFVVFASIVGLLQLVVLVVVKVAVVMVVVCLSDETVCVFVSWCFEPSHPQRITSGLNTNLIL